jgi:hypothetical protein
MLGLFLIYFIGKAFYQLAFEFEKNNWGFAILGIISYYAGTFIGGIILGIIGLLANSDFMETMPNLAINLIALPFGLLACWGFYKILENRWSRPKTVNPSDTLDSTFLN